MIIGNILNMYIHRPLTLTLINEVTEREKKQRIEVKQVQGHSQHEAEEATASSDLVRAPTRRRRMLLFWERYTNTALTKLLYPKS